MNYFRQLSIALTIASCLYAETTTAQLVDNMQSTNSFYMFGNDQQGLDVSASGGLVTLTKTDDVAEHNFIRWSQASKQPADLEDSDTIEIDFPDFGSATKLQVYVNLYQKNGKSLGGALKLIDGFNTREPMTQSINLVEFAKENNLDGDPFALRLLFRHTGKPDPSSTIKIDEIRFTNSREDPIVRKQSSEFPEVPSQPFIFGVCTSMGKQFAGRSQLTTLELVDEAGFSSIRDSIRWVDVERQKGKPVIPPFADSMVATCEEKGVEPLILLLYGNRHYDNGSFPISEEAEEGFIRYAETVVRHFKGRVKYYEMWNEWDMGLGQPRGKDGKRPKGTPESYAKFVAALYPRLKAIDPDAIFLAGGHAAQSLRRSDWFDLALQEGLIENCDGLAMHTYTSPMRSPEYWCQWVNMLNEKYSREYNDGKPVPFYITETGWYTKEQNELDYQVQAEYAARTLLLAKTMPNLHGMWYFCLNGMPQFELSYKGTPLPVFWVMRDLKPIVEDARFLGRIETSDPNVWVMRYEMADGKEMWAAWGTAPLQFAEGRWANPIVGHYSLELRSTSNGTHRPITLHELGRDTITRSWGMRLVIEGEVDPALTTLAIGPMPLIIQGDLDQIEIVSVTPPANASEVTSGDVEPL